MPKKKSAATHVNLRKSDKQSLAALNALMTPGSGTLGKSALTEALFSAGDGPVVIHLPKSPTKKKRVEFTNS